MGVGQRIKELRKQGGMTQAELAERVGVHETTIRRWEKETDSGPDTAMIVKIAEALNATIEELLSENSNALGDKEGTEKERNLVYEWGGTNRLALPNTPEARALFERLVMCVLAGRQPAMT